MEHETMVRLKRRAMGSEFELVLCGEEQNYLIDAGNEAFEELARLEEQLSIFIPSSELSHINALAGRGPVRVEPGLFDLLEASARLTWETWGAFDISAGPLVRRWGFADGTASSEIPSGDEIEDVRKAVGMRHVELDGEEYTVRFSRPGMEINLGAVGKGYAVREMVSVLRGLGIGAGLVSAGSSTIYAIGSRPGADGWTIGIRSPLDRTRRIGAIKLADRAISTSGGREQFTEAAGARYSHVIDPRTGLPARGVLAASAVAPDPVESDALSTAFCVLGVEKTGEYCDTHDGVGALLIPEPERDSALETIEIGLLAQMEVFADER